MLSCRSCTKAVEGKTLINLRYYTQKQRSRFGQKKPTQLVGSVRSAHGHTDGRSNHARITFRRVHYTFKGPAGGWGKPNRKQSSFNSRLRNFNLPLLWPSLSSSWCPFLWLTTNLVHSKPILRIPRFNLMDFKRSKRPLSYKRQWRPTAKALIITPGWAETSALRSIIISESVNNAFSQNEFSETLLHRTYPESGDKFPKTLLCTSPVGHWCFCSALLQRFSKCDDLVVKGSVGVWNRTSLGERAKGLTCRTRALLPSRPGRPSMWDTL